jgi:hypothetical protein
MPGPYIQPDPDLRVAESNSAPALRAEAGKLFAAENDVARQINAIAATNEGQGAEREVKNLEATKASLDNAAVVLTRTAELHEALAVAAATYRREVPTGLEIFAAWAVTEKIRWEVAAHAEAGGPEYLAAKKEQRRAQNELDDLERRRAEAIAAFEDARGVALEKFRGQVPDAPAVEVGGETPLGTPAPRTATPTVPAPEVPATTPLPARAAPAELPSAATPSDATPDTNLASVPGTGGGLTPAQAAVLGAALSQQLGQSQQQPVQIPQPQMAAPAPALTPPQQQRRAEDPFADYDPNAVLAGLARGDFRPATATVAAPAITPMNQPPTFTPLSPGSSLSGLTPVNPVVAQPVVTGTSTAGLITDNNVSGRPDGATARTATSPAPSTNLSGAIVDQASGRAPAAGVGTGMGGIPPMMGPMMGGLGGSGAAKDREPVTATMTPDQARLLGLEAIGEAVPGGTIARKDDAA